MFRSIAQSVAAHSSTSTPSMTRCSTAVLEMDLRIQRCGPGIGQLAECERSFILNEVGHGDGGETTPRSLQFRSEILGDLPDAVQVSGYGAVNGGHEASIGQTA